MTAAAQDGTKGRPVALFVMGMGRSGTSALTRVLSLCGGALPNALVGASAGNPLGHWEPRAALYLNEAILHRHGTTGYDPTLRLQEEGAFDTEERAACVGEMKDFFATLPTAPLVLIKEQRITALSGMWFEAARSAEFDVAAAISVRHPQEVVSSVVARWGLSPELASALWLKYTLLAERHTRAVPRVFVEYVNLLEDWRKEVTRISAALPIELNIRDEVAVDEFLRPDLRRQRHGGPVTEPFGTDWIFAVYQALCAAARDEPLDESALDRVFAEYRASEFGFRTAFKDFHDHFNSVRSRLIKPSIAKRILEAVAIAHRRSGTWA